VAVSKRHASFTGLDGGNVDPTAPIPRTGRSRLADRAEHHYELKGLAEDRIATAAAEQARSN
jgi:hypothetical protein